MKFKTFINEDNFLQKIINFLRTPEYNDGKEFANMCKKEAKLRWGEDLDKEFRSYGYCLLFSEHPKVWEHPKVRSFRAYINLSKGKLIIVCCENFAYPKFIVYEKGDFNLLHPSYYVACDYERNYDAIEYICNSSSLAVEERYTFFHDRPTDFPKPFLFWAMENARDTIKISSDDYRENLSSDKLPDDVMRYFGDIISKKEMNTLLAGKCESSQFVLFMRLMFVGNLPEKEYLNIASKYNV